MKRLFKDKRVFLVVISVFIIIFGVSGYFLGLHKGLAAPKEVRVSEFKNINDGNDDAVDFGLFWETWKTVKDKFVDSSKADSKKLLYGAISGMVSAFGDPHTTFFSPEEAKDFGEEISGEFSGVGMELGVRDEQITVIAPLKGTPAYRAGVKSGDKILEIDGKNTTGMNQDEAIKLIRGPKNTKVILTIARTGETEPKVFSIIRDTIQIPTLDWEMKEGNIAYVRLYNFYEKAPMAFYQAAIQILIDKPKGIVLDLRNNPGGFLDAGINIAGWFLPKGKIIVKEQFASGDPQISTSSADGYIKDIPLVILVNQGSASASEIVAGALRDNRGVKLVGERTFGKGTVQELVDLSSGAQVKVTIAHWVMPNGGILGTEGLAPDYEVKMTEEDFKNNRDPQLEKALEVVRLESN